MVVVSFAANSIQLVPDASLVLHVVMVLAMVGVLKLTLYGPINRVLEEREKFDKRAVDGVAEVLTRVKEKESQYRSALREARTNGYRLLERERGRALGERDERVDAAKAETAAWVAAQMQQIDGELSEARMTLQAESKNSALRICSRILGAAGGGSAGRDSSK